MVSDAGAMLDAYVTGAGIAQCFPGFLRGAPLRRGDRCDNRPAWHSTCQHPQDRLITMLAECVRTVLLSLGLVAVATLAASHRLQRRKDARRRIAHTQVPQVDVSAQADFHPSGT